MPNNPNLNQIILAGLAEQAADPPTGTTGAGQPDGSVKSEVGPVPVDPLLYASLLRGVAKALYTPNRCVVDPLNLGYGKGDAAQVELINPWGPPARKSELNARLVDRPWPADRRHGVVVRVTRSPDSERCEHHELRADERDE